MKKKTSIEFALYRLERAKQEQATAELLYKENKLLAGLYVKGRIRKAAYFLETFRKASLKIN